IPENKLFEAPNTQSNSVGNLILHLNGNVRQWLLSGLLGKEFKRNRAQEFDQSTGTKAELTSLLSELEKDIKVGLSHLREDSLIQEISIQGISGTGFAVAIHVIEHFSYHTGQIALLTKLWCNEDLGFYSEHPHLND
ncbi:MAG: DinB family protein, partial [Luteibaculum sp.]